MRAEQGERVAMGASKQGRNGPAIGFPGLIARLICGDHH
jgi:hypothetical protein